jgi:hypothetical protein
VHKRSIAAAVLGFLMVLFSSAFSLSFAVFALLSLPLSVLSFIHLTGWGWFVAIICVVLLASIPVLGQLGYLVLAGIGAYYLLNAGFDWQKAAYPATQTFSVSTLSESELEQFRSNVVRPGFERACKSDALQTSGLDGKLPAYIASRCECFAFNFATKVTRDDLIAYETSGQYPADVQQRLAKDLQLACPN